MTNIPESLAALAVPIKDLMPYGRNPRRGNVAVIQESLAEHGQYRPVVVRRGTNEVLAGNHTLFAARELGWDQLAATYVDVDDEQAARIVLVDNRAADMGSYDDADLLEILKELDATDAGLGATGYADDDLDDLVALLSEKEPTVPAGTESPDKDNAWESTDLKEYAERYEEQGRRLIVLDYDRSTYARVTAGMDQLRTKYGEESNSAAVAAHLAALFPQATADATEPISA
ncbi:ParB/RepB/Spo0J family partition protein [Kribbella sp. NPDC058245]|uniref:ParB/RepB/Spo0J family partition protein n=1 Tax=Kribbella sp. NPDC058245 TaxID=3346399 RepID=UPI0036F0B91C